ncbi:MAG: cation:proton antiporter [Gemmatimonadota bacterium]|nr:cation:proton antiporter [Gemmatimonadota bacterium]
MTTTGGVIILYCIVTVVAVVTKRFRVPYTAALLLIGVLVGGLHLVDLPRLTKELLFAIFLPGLLFEAAYHLKPRELRENAWAIVTLAVPGVAITIGLIAMFLVAGSAVLGTEGVLWSTGLIFGAVIAATDPVAVTALFREVAAPRRLHVLVESESLFNDGTSIVFLTLLLAYFAGDAPTTASLFVAFVRIAGGGALIGLAVGWAISHVRTRLDDAAIEITLTTIAAYGAFALAEQFHFSGVIATVCAGVICGHLGRTSPMTAGTHAAVNGFWEWLAFALNSAVFLLLGAEISAIFLLREWKLVLLGALSALVARSIVVFLASLGLHRTKERIPPAWGAILVWGGLRGALSLVLALALPLETHNRTLIVALTAGTVMLSLVGQGGSMPRLLRRLNLKGD